MPFCSASRVTLPISGPRDGHVEVNGGDSAVPLFVCLPAAGFLRPEMRRQIRVVARVPITVIRLRSICDHSVGTAPAAVACIPYRAGPSQISRAYVGLTVVTRSAKLYAGFSRIDDPVGQILGVQIRIDAVQSQIGPAAAASGKMP